MTTQRPSVIVLIGPPGSGKGTLSQQCVQRLGWIKLSTGNLCRKAVAEQTPLGKKIECSMNAGRLVSDDLIGGLVHEWLDEQLNKGETILLDGYPRSKSQAIMLQDFLGKIRGITVCVVRFVVSQDLVIRRLTHRLVCVNVACQAVYSSDGFGTTTHCQRCDGLLVRRSDDSLEVVRERLKTYQVHEREVFDFYKFDTHVDVVELLSEGNPESVFERFCMIFRIGDA